MSKQLTIDDELSLVEQAKFNNITCDFYQDNSGTMFMTRKQIANALGYANESAIRNMQEDSDKDFDGLVTSYYITKLEGNREVSRERVIFNRRGIEQVARFATKPKANDFMDFVFNIYNKYQDEGQVSRLENQIKEVAKDSEEERLMKKINLLQQQLELENDEFSIKTVGMQIESVKRELEQHRNSRQLDKNTQKLENVEDRVDNLEGKNIPDDYCKAYQIAKELGVTSSSGRPHAQLIGAIARKLGFKLNEDPGYEDDNVKRVYGNNGTGKQTYYTPNGKERIKKYFKNQKFNFKYTKKYQRDSRYGNKGEVREEGYHIRGTKFVTYKAAVNN